MPVILEGLVLSFWLLLICVAGIAKEGPGCGTLIGFPILAAMIAGVMQLINV